jgi:hypothetical protein
MTLDDQQLLQKASGRAGEALGVLQWNNDFHIVEIYSRLHSHLGGDELLMRHWMGTPNKHLNGKIPANLLTTEAGELEVIALLYSYSQ